MSCDAKKFNSFIDLLDHKSTVRYMCSALFNYFFSKLWISLTAFSCSSLVDVYFDWEIEILDQGHALFLRNACFSQWTMREREREIRQVNNKNYF